MPLFTFTRIFCQKLLKILKATGYYIQSIIDNSESMAGNIGNNVAGILVMAVLCSLCSLSQAAYQPWLNLTLSSSVVDISLAPDNITLSKQPIYFVAGTIDGQLIFYNDQRSVLTIPIIGASIKKVTWVSKFIIFMVTRSSAHVYNISQQQIVLDYNFEGSQVLESVCQFWNNQFYVAFQIVNDLQIYKGRDKIYNISSLHTVTALSFDTKASLFYFFDGPNRTIIDLATLAPYNTIQFDKKYLKMSLNNRVGYQDVSVGIAEDGDLSIFNKETQIQEYPGTNLLLVDFCDWSENMMVAFNRYSLLDLWLPQTPVNTPWKISSNFKITQTVSKVQCKNLHILAYAQQQKRAILYQHSYPDKPGSWGWIVAIIFSVTFVVIVAALLSSVFCKKYKLKKLIKKRRRMIEEKESKYSTQKRSEYSTKSVQNPVKKVNTSSLMQQAKSEGYLPPSKW